MRKRIVSTSLILVVLLLTSLPLHAQEDGSDGKFTMVSDTNIIDTALYDWDRGYNEPGAVTYHEGQFHMLRNGVPGWPASGSLGYMVSDDGINWEEVSSEPIFATADVPYVEISLHASSLIMDDDGTWILYFYAYQNVNYLSDVNIGRATAPELTGPWTADDDFVLTPGADGDWDGGSVRTPHVIRTDDGQWLMYFTGINDRGLPQIGLATSSDGIEWEKYDDPATTEAPYAASDPVLIGERDSENGTRWEARIAEHPFVEITDNGYQMIYKAGGGLGLAFSEDGIAWTKSSANPVLRVTDTPANAIAIVRSVHVDDTYYTYFEGRSIDPDAGLTTIYLASFTGELVR